ncbi:Bug family tripartite tricarboxylate transporter substrate binding protein [Bordetella hinzii]|uniref:Tripartite tricarboxylate transporter family receptor n=1 Tax=Bordetella hinzii OH87 BAL007II TaxID=1331262 RepID=A0ABR4R5K8_9BORD|nr:tripartite tricarboxylate transporter substrate binding protein [Bordetella hinzii]KCB26259.1 tripartite tricarboxylate transporter family receptor [Bordetella hinzii OH87 BAL007II]KCB29609.1 tripartite tricarboxylate transporter family receptor [Bordetella hinzii CA90 BAL1384]KCB40116.1 tripartite tricarboxylate transporter family receptor [Bordetella hinzii 5132]QDJ40661.1 tripartite tricarboxylate transporter substrate binding protein [Bordetella hinzii]QDJ45220.1 tripartite tricarboxyla
MKRALAALLCLGALFGAGAKADYPDRGVKIIVPFPAGQTTDVLARTIGQQLTESLGQAFFVDNRGGAGGIIGMEGAKRSDADGYTLLMASSGPLAINPGLYRKLPYDTLKDFTAVSMVVVVPQFLVTRADFPANNLKELIDYVKKHPGQLNYGSGGTGLTNHLTMEMFKRQAGLNIMHVPYRGAAAALTGLMSGDVAMMFESGPAIMPHVQKGALKVFAVGSRNGSKALPDIPTMDRAGVPGFDAQTWAALLVPKGTSASIVEKLNKTMQIALQKPAVQQQLAALGAEVMLSTPDQTNTYIKAEIARWGDTIKTANVQLE